MSDNWSPVYLFTSDTKTTGQKKIILRRKHCEDRLPGIAAISEQPTRRSQSHAVEAEVGFDRLPALHVDLTTNDVTHFPASTCRPALFPNHRKPWLSAVSTASLTVRSSAWLTFQIFLLFSVRVGLNLKRGPHKQPLSRITPTHLVPLFFPLVSTRLISLQKKNCRETRICFLKQTWTSVSPESQVALRISLCCQENLRLTLCSSGHPGGLNHQ